MLLDIVMLGVLLLRIFLRWFFAHQVIIFFVVLRCSGNHVIIENFTEATSTFVFLDLLKHLQLLIELNLPLGLLFDHLVCLVVDLKVAKRNALELDELLGLVHLFVHTSIHLSDAEKK